MKNPESKRSRNSSTPAINRTESQRTATICKKTSWHESASRIKAKQSINRTVNLNDSIGQIDENPAHEEPCNHKRPSRIEHHEAEMRVEFRPLEMLLDPVHIIQKSLIAAQAAADLFVGFRWCSWRHRPSPWLRLGSSSTKNHLVLC